MNNQSIIEQRLAQIAAILGGLGILVERARQAAYEANECPALNITRQSSESVQHAQHLQKSLVNFELTFSVTGADWEMQADALHVQANGLLFADDALCASEIGLLCTGTEVQADEAGSTVGKLTARYRFYVLTPPGALHREIF